MVLAYFGKEGGLKAHCGLHGQIPFPAKKSLFGFKVTNHKTNTPENYFIFHYTFIHSAQAGFVQNINEE